MALLQHVTLDEGSTHSLAATTASEFPDLVSDTEEDEEVDIVSSGDWALVPDPSGSDNVPSGDAAGLDTDVDVMVDHDEETTDPVNGAWVFLAEDDS
ncbi:hypothetical protein ONZ43_g4432 [Nemania bipapillata]|uniref:Uncharacterized protein n=1 Tax=Nemania bipapillata TaxID=110536 RepID=A0ACC2IMW8_9PEZI|nr:hypothetical protein ONZ43_g4432 [Nemania bipapillata]